MKEAEQWHLLELAERSLDGRLSEAERSELNGLLRDNAEARALFARALHQHAELRFDEHLTRELTQPEMAMPASATKTRSSGFSPLLRIAAHNLPLMVMAVIVALFYFGRSIAGESQSVEQPKPDPAE